MIRPATLDDMPTILALGAEFLAASPHCWIPLDAAAFEGFAKNLIEGAGAIFLSDDGFIGGVLAPCYFNPAYTFASELFWFARKEGQELRKAFEAWGRAAGVDAITCSGLADSHERAIRRIWSRAGYDATEVAFMKRIA